MNWDYYSVDVAWQDIQSRHVLLKTKTYPYHLNLSIYSPTMIRATREHALHDCYEQLNLNCMLGVTIFKSMTLLYVNIEG